MLLAPGIGRLTESIIDLDLVEDPGEETLVPAETVGRTRLPGAQTVPRR